MAHKRLPLVVFGARGHGRVVLDAAQLAGYEVQWFIDDEPPEEDVCGIEVIKTTDGRWKALSHFSFLVAIGDNPVRAALFQQLLLKGGCPANIIHPSACIASTASLARGIAICAGVIVNPGAQIGDNCIINTAASVDHDCVVEEHAHISPGVRLAGAVTVGRGAMIGTGASVIPGVRIGDWAVIGAGAVVVRDIPPGVVAYGTPALVRRSLAKAKPLYTPTCRMSVGP